MRGNDTKDQPLRKTASVTVTTPVDGTKRRRRSPIKSQPQVIATALTMDDVVPEVAKAARAVRKPGQVFRVVSPTIVRVVNK